VRSDGRMSSQYDFVALLEGDNGFFPVGRLAGLLGALAAEFSADIEGVHFEDLDLEQVLDRLADLHLVSTRVGDHSVLIKRPGLDFLRAVLAFDFVTDRQHSLASAFFGQADGLDNFKSVHKRGR